MKQPYKSLHYFPLSMASWKSIHSNLLFSSPKSLYTALYILHLYTKFSATLINQMSAFPIPPSNQYCQSIIAPPTNSQTMSPTSCKPLYKHSHLSSVTITISYNSLNLSHFLLIITSHSPIQLAFSQLLHTIS